MPTYRYECNRCRRRFEVIRRMSDTAPEMCPECGDISRRVFVPPEGGFILKGAGFYTTDYKRPLAAEKKKIEKMTPDLPVEAMPNFREIKKIGKEVIAMKKSGESKERINKMGDEVYAYTNANKKDKQDVRL